MVRIGRKQLKRMGPFGASLVLAACAGGPSLPALHADPAMRFESLSVCHGYGCTSQSRAGLDAQEIARLAALFEPHAATAEEERAHLGEAVALMETLIGAKTGTSADKAGAGVFGGYKQQDCIDEAVNTTHYLTLMERAGWLAHHRVGAPAHRGVEIGRWPHNTATIEEIASGARFVVDSWFHANGAAPEIVPLALWKSGWGPEAR